MSLATWKEEFYPCVPDPEWDDISCLEHSIRKWIGLRAENLAKHKITKRPNGNPVLDSSGEYFVVDNESCACCVRAEDFRSRNRTGCSCTADCCADCAPVPFESGHAHEEYCSVCPVYQSREKWACDTQRTDEDNNSPYFIWVDEGDPEPMIEALTYALKWAGGKP